MKVQWLGVNNLTVQFFKIILAGSNLVFDDQSVRSRKIGHGSRVELAI